MATSMVEIEVSNAEHLLMTEDTLGVDLSDGRTILVPLAWFPRLLHASQEELSYWCLSGKDRELIGRIWERTLSLRACRLGLLPEKVSPRLRNGWKVGHPKPVRIKFIG